MLHNFADWFQLSLDYDGDPFIFPIDLDEPDYQRRWRVWEVQSDGSLSKASISSPLMTVEDGVVANPLYFSGHQHVDSWYLQSDEIELRIDSGPPIRVRHPWWALGTPQSAERTNERPPVQNTTPGESHDVARVSKIADVFAAMFEPWSIHLPNQSIDDTSPGELRERGWRIRFTWGSNEGHPFLDFYASHRMTDDRHERIHGDGEIEGLDALLNWTVYPADASEEEKREADAKFDDHNARVTAELQRKFADLASG